MDKDPLSSVPLSPEIQNLIGSGTRREYRILASESFFNELDEMLASEKECIASYRALPDWELIKK